MKKPLLIIIPALVLALGIAAFFWAESGSVIDGQESTASLDRGIELFEQEQYAEALTELQPLADSGSENWRAWYYLGSTQMMLRDFPAASAALERSLALSPDETGTLYALGVAYYKQGKIKLAKAYFAAVLEINPNDEQARGLMDTMTRLEQNPAQAPKVHGMSSHGKVEGGS